MRSGWIILVLSVGCASAQPSVPTPIDLELPRELQVVLTVMQYGQNRWHGDLQDFAINEELESTMPWWTEVDPASLEADFPPENGWSIPVQLWSGLPCRVRPNKLFDPLQLDGFFRRHPNFPSQWEVYQRMKPNLKGLYAFERPAFSRDGGTAKVYWTRYGTSPDEWPDLGHARLFCIQGHWMIVEWFEDSLRDVSFGPCVKSIE